LKVSTFYGQHHWKNSALVNRVFIISIYFFLQILSILTISSKLAEIIFANIISY